MMGTMSYLRTEGPSVTRERENEKTTGVGRQNTAPPTLGPVLLLALGIRLVILFSGQEYLRSDEAVVGMMARHIVTRGERPTFLYGQHYGGGHALVAYLAAPLFQAFGTSGTLLTGITMTFGLANIVIVFLIARGHLPPRAARAATLLYAVAPPVMYSHFLVNGGTEAMFFALLALFFFLKTVRARGRKFSLGRMEGGPFLAGVFSGVAYWCMDFTLVYPVTFVLVWLFRARRRFLRKAAPFFLGAVLGALPVIHYDVETGGEHLAAMLPSAGGSGPPFPGRALEAVTSMWLTDIPAFLHVRIDDFPWRATRKSFATVFHGVPAGSWLHYAVFLIGLSAVVKHVWQQRRETRKTAATLEGVLLVYLGVFCLLYALSGFTASVRRTPRYLLPLYPLVPLVIAAGFGRIGVARPHLRRLAAAVVVVLAVRGLAVDRQMMFTDVAEEHHIPISGRAVREAAHFLTARGIRYAIAPYELQWRLMFESGGNIEVACTGISRKPRYGPVEERVIERALLGSAPYAAVFTPGFSFARLWMRPDGRPVGLITHRIWEDMGIVAHERRFGDNLVVYYDFSDNFVKRIFEVHERKPGADR